jgi:hypothetical protein
MIKMGKITREELDDSLLNVIDNAGDNSDIGDVADLLTNDKSLVGAINELFQSANNGKQLIADAIGEPLNAEDTFAAMGNDIKGLLSTFKTNMMNNGIVVEAGDKFKSLIDKIAAMVGDNSGKGIQFAEGSGSWKLENNSYSSQSVTITTNLNFTPTYVFVYGEYAQLSGNMMMMGNASLSIDNIIVSNLGAIGSSGDTTLGQLSISDITASSFKLKTSVANYYKISATKWFAIGVGEEDTTLRDSLASILGEEGVEVTEDDDMASLITKVNGEFDRKNEEIANSGGLDIISATALPATGKENQICVITDNPTDKFILSYEASDHTDESAIFGEMLLKPSSASFTVNSGSISQKHTFFAFSQNGDTKPSYIYQNNNWNTFTPDYFYVVNNSSFNTNVFGDFIEYNDRFSKGDYVTISSSGLQLLYKGGYYTYAFRALQNEVDFSLFSKMYVKAYTTTTSSSSQMYLYLGLAKSDSAGSNLVKYGYAASTSLSSGQESTCMEPFATLTLRTNNTTAYPIEHTIDISDLNKRGYLVIGSFIGVITITDLYFY